MNELENEEQLASEVQLGDLDSLSYEVPPDLDQLSEDAADGPDVHFAPVLGRADQQLRGPVPPGCNVLGHDLTWP